MLSGSFLRLSFPISLALLVMLSLNKVRTNWQSSSQPLMDDMLAFLICWLLWLCESSTMTITRPVHSSKELPAELQNYCFQQLSRWSLGHTVTCVPKVWQWQVEGQARDTIMVAGKVNIPTSGRTGLIEISLGRCVSYFFSRFIYCVGINQDLVHLFIYTLRYFQISSSSLLVITTLIENTI